MKAQIHPKYYPEAKVTCACGNTWTTGSTKPEILVDICSNCHPFYTGVQRIVDTEGQVDRFYKRLEVRTQFKQAEESKAAAKVSPERPLAELDLTKRTVVAIEGVGTKALADTKKALKRLGYELPASEPAAEAEKATS